VSPRTLDLSDERLYDYYRRVGLREHPALAGLREATDVLPDGGMRSSAEQSQLLALLAELTGVRRALEVGCFTGYTTLTLALALPPDGRVVTLEADERWPAIGRPYWEQAGVAGRIELRIGRAEAGLRRLLAEDGPGRFDLAYIDADKRRYPAYYELTLELVRPGGVIALDNMLRDGAVADPTDRSPQTETIRALNAKLHADERVSLVMLPVGDGVTLLRKRAG